MRSSVLHSSRFGNVETCAETDDVAIGGIRYTLSINQKGPLFGGWHRYSCRLHFASRLSLFCQLQHLQKRLSCRELGRPLNRVSFPHSLKPDDRFIGSLRSVVSGRVVRHLSFVELLGEHKERLLAVSNARGEPDLFYIPTSFIDSIVKMIERESQASHGVA